MSTQQRINCKAFGLTASVPIKKLPELDNVMLTLSDHFCRLTKKTLGFS